MQPQRTTSSGAQLNTAHKRDSQVQGLKSRLRVNMNSIVENYEMILSRARIDLGDDSFPGLSAFTQAEQDTFEMSVRAANIVHACENLTRLVSEIKQLLILGDFRWLAQTTMKNREDLRQRRVDLDRASIRLRDKLAADLYGVEEECSNFNPSFAFGADCCLGSIETSSSLTVPTHSDDVKPKWS